MSEAAISRGSSYTMIRSKKPGGRFHFKQKEETPKFKHSIVLDMLSVK